MAIDYAQLKIDDAAGHPTTGAFNADPAIAAGEWNALNRDGDADGAALLQYVLLERRQGGNLYGRIRELANVQVGFNASNPVNDWEIPPVPLGTAGALVVPTHDQIEAAGSMLRILGTDIGININLLDSRVDTILTDLVQADAIGSTDKTAIQALSQGAQSYASELGYPNLSTNDIARARAEP